MRPSLLLYLLAGLVTLAEPSAAQRTPDGLHHRPDLQRVVQFQTDRDAASLVAMLDDPDPAVRARAAFSLASVQDSAATEPLLALLEDAVAAVRADAAFALGQQPGHVPSEPLLTALPDEREPAVRRLLMEALGKTGDAASLAVLASTEVPDAEEAALALALARYALRDLHDDQAVRRLLDLLASPEPRTRLDAAYYFGRSRRTEPWAAHADTVRARLDALDPDDPAAMHLVTALGRLAAPEDVPRLTHGLSDAADWRIRTNAARALAAHAGTTAPRHALFEALDDPSHHVAFTAAGVLADAEWDDATTEAAALWLEAHRTDTTNASSQIAGALLEGLARDGRTQFVLDEVAARRDRSDAAYRHALRALVPLPFDDAFPLLREAAAHENPRVAYAALTALGARWPTGEDDSRARSYFDAFADAVHRADIATVYAAAPRLSDSAFVDLGAVDVLAEVYRSLEAPDEIEAMTALLGALGATEAPPAVPVLEEALAHPHPTVRAAAADALEEITGSRPAVPPFQDATATVPALDWDYLRALGPQPMMVMETRCGAVTLTFDAEQAPLTTQTLLRFAERGAYDGVPFHRVVPNFVVQGGDFARGDGFGGPGFVIRSEFTRVPYRRGTAGMASAGKDTEGSQFFVTHSMQPHLDGRYTAFGTVTDGLEVVDCIQEDDRIVRATVVRDD